MARRIPLWLVGIAAGAVWLPGWSVPGAEEAPPAAGSAPAILADGPDEAVGTPTVTVWDETSSADVRSELIRERYPNRNIKIERQVIQDAQENFVNHGKWKMWDPNGSIMAEGDFENGRRQGTWVRWLHGEESKMLATMPYLQFRAPFISQAAFANGQLHGRWTIYDSKQRKISEWQFVDGQRDGTWTWWYANGRKMREIEYRAGNIDGKYREWSPENAPSIDDTYQEGRKLARKLTYQKDSRSRKESEGLYLHAKIVPETDDDWWNCELAKFSAQGKDEKHGPWTSWYTTDQKRLDGKYEHDVQVGTFTWWHPNGQIAAEGVYDAGRQIGKWTWWHPNGQKSIQGEFSSGAPSGRWTWWKEDGKVAQRADFTNTKGQLVERPLPQDEQPSLPRRATSSKSRSPERR